MREQQSSKSASSKGSVNVLGTGGQTFQPLVAEGHLRCVLAPAVLGEDCFSSGLSSAAEPSFKDASWRKKKSGHTLPIIDCARYQHLHHKDEHIIPSCAGAQQAVLHRPTPQEDPGRQGPWRHAAHFVQARSHSVAGKT